MKKILIVDDDATLGDLIAEFCRGAGFDSRVVTDSRSVLRVAEEWRPDLITLDLEMPGMDGVEVLRELQGRPDLRRIPVIVVSVVARGALERGLLAGVPAVFEKPLKFQKLVAKLSELLSLSDPKASKKVAFHPSIGILS